MVNNMRLLWMWDLRAGRTGTNIVKSTGIVWIKINQEMTPEEFKDVLFDT